MRIIQYHEYGDPSVLQLVETDRPVPGDKQVLVRVRAVGINPVDWKIRRGNLKIADGRGFPKAVGCELAGEVVSWGDQVEGYAVGDRVFGAVPFDRLGALAEYALVDAQQLHPIPGDLPYADAAAVVMVGSTALQAFTDEVPELTGKQVLVNGASGGVGHLAVQIAKLEGAHVTATAGSGHQEFVASLGPQQTLDYNTVDVREHTGRYDAILDTSGKLPWSDAKPMLRKGGTYIDLQTGLKAVVGSFVNNIFSSKTHDIMMVKVKKASLATLATFIERGELKPTVGLRFAFEEYREAYRQLESGDISHVGKAVFTI